MPPVLFMARGGSDASDYSSQSQLHGPHNLSGKALGLVAFLHGPISQNLAGLAGANLHVSLIAHQSLCT